MHFDVMAYNIFNSILLIRLDIEIHDSQKEVPIAAGIKDYCTYI